MVQLQCSKWPNSFCFYLFGSSETHASSSAVLLKTTAQKDHGKSRLESEKPSCPHGQAGPRLSHLSNIPDKSDTIFNVSALTSLLLNLHKTPQTEPGEKIHPSCALACSSCYNRISQTRCFKQQMFISPSSGDWEVQGQRTDRFGA